MEFSRIGTRTIRCIITEEEIANLGYSLDEILSNADKTQDFMNEIFDIAEREMGIQFDVGMKTVRADFLPNHTISLTFTVGDRKQAVTELFEQLVRKIENADFLSSTEEKTDSTKGDLSEIKLMMFTCDSFDRLAMLARAIQQNYPQVDETSALYKLNGTYYIKVDTGDLSEEGYDNLYYIGDELTDHIVLLEGEVVYRMEHGEVVLADHAISALAQL